MTVEVLIFGAAAHHANTDRVPITLTDSATASDALNALARQHPHLAFATSGARLAINHAFAAPDSPILPTDELALISLVGGG